MVENDESVVIVCEICGAETIYSGFGRIIKDQYFAKTCGSRQCRYGMEKKNKGLRIKNDEDQN